MKQRIRFAASPSSHAFVSRKGRQKREERKKQEWARLWRRYSPPIPFAAFASNQHAVSCPIRQVHTSRIPKVAISVFHAKDAKTAKNAKKTKWALLLEQPFNSLSGLCELCGLCEKPTRRFGSNTTSTHKPNTESRDKRISRKGRKNRKERKKRKGAWLCTAYALQFPLRPLREAYTWDHGLTSGKISTMLLLYRPLDQLLKQRTRLMPIFEPRRRCYALGKLRKSGRSQSASFARAERDV